MGCPWVGRGYAEQLAEKAERLRRALAAHTELGRYRLVAPSGSPERFGYRNHAKLVFRTRRAARAPGREVLLGVYRPGTHSVLPADDCAVHDRLLRPVLLDLRRSVEGLEVPIFDERRRTGDLRYALARCSRLSGQVHLTLVAARSRPRWLSELVRGLRRRHGNLESVFLCTNPTPGNVLLTRDVRRVFGPPALLERLGERVLESRPDAFLQANPGVASNLYRAAARALELDGPARIVDVYCGVGSIGLSVARERDRLYGLESSASAVACARRNARRAGVRHARFRDAPAEGLARFASEHDLFRPDAVLVNPPRKGLAGTVARQVADLEPAKILYVSCDPETLARDLGRLASRGYRLERVQAFDMLPQTPHVEALALLSRSPAAVNRRR